MRIGRILTHSCLVVAALSVAHCSGDGDPVPLARCETDLSAWTKSGAGASAKVATTEDLFKGDAALGREGDILLSNSKIRVLVERPSERIGTKPQGGNIIDADIVRPGEQGHDQFGELPPFFNFGRTLEYERIEILDDGSKGGPAIVAATGRDAAYDFIHLQGLLGRVLTGMSLPDVDKSLHLRATTYYVLNADSEAVHVVQSLCYEGDEDLDLAVGDLVNGGGNVEVFGGYGGFGSTGAGGLSDIITALGANDGHPFYGYLADNVAYGYVPEAEFAQVLTVSGVTGTIFNSPDISQWLSTRDTPEGALMFDKGDKATVARDFIVTRDAAGIYDYYYRKSGVKTGTLKGRVLGADGTPRAGVRVSALVGSEDGRVASLFTTDAEGRFEGLVPAGKINLQADDNGLRSDALTLSVAEGATLEQDVSLPARATLAVKIRNAENAPIPGKVTIACVGNCAYSRTDKYARRFTDTGADPLPVVGGNETFDIRYVGPEAQVDVDVPPGDYVVWVSRGAEWSLEKREVTAVAGETKALEVKLEHVVDTTGWMSGDLHVHAISSPDSVVANVDRLVSFMAEGTDVLVSTDHEIIFDFSPVLATIPNGDKFLKTITGLELTTFDYGHYNSFPLVRDNSMRNGGAPDWGNGNDRGMTPGDIFETLHSLPGSNERVIQLNHARGMLGGFSAMGLDTRTFWTTAPPERYRIRPVEPDPVTGDTRLFSDNFTAIEIMNGHSVADFNELLRDWFAMLNRGLVRAGTAVSDTHTRHGVAGIPRTYVKVGQDDPLKLDAEVFAAALNAREAFGTNGPVLLVNAKADGEAGGAGATVKTNGGAVTLDVEVRVPHWMKVSEALVFVNTKGTETDGTRDPLNTLPAPQAQAELEFESVTVGASSAKKAVATFNLPVAEDSWIVVVVRGGDDMFPVVGTGGVQPLAFSNPVLIDVGGDGWKAPIDLEAERARIGQVASSSAPLMSEISEAELREVLSASCRHRH